MEEKSAVVLKKRKHDDENDDKLGNDGEYVFGWPGSVGTGIEFKPVPRIVHEVQDFLKLRGHTCAMYNISKAKLRWCQKDDCEDVAMRKQMDEEQRNQDQFAAELAAKGHMCIQYMESYPVQIHWCNQEPCTEVDVDKGG